MTLVLATFLLVSAVVFLVYWLLAERSEGREQRALRRRLRAAPPRSVAVSGSFLKDAEPFSSLGPVNAVLTRAGGVTRPLQLLLAQAGLKWSVGSLLLISAVAAVVTAALVVWLTRLWLLGLAAGAVASLLPYTYVKRQATKRILVFEEQFPEAITLIARALRAGHAFTTGLAMVAEEAPQPVAGEFRVLYDQQNFGMPMADALRAFAKRIPLLDARFFATAVLTQREAGGNLAEVLDNLAVVIRDRFKVKRQIRVITAHARVTGWVLAGMPPALAVAFMIMTPGHLTLLVRDPLGVKMIIGALCLQTVGVLVIRRLIDIDY